MSRRSAWFVAAALCFVAFAASAVSENWTLALGMVAIGLCMSVLGMRESAER
jgi:4-hydroxybenzoate polyprenyltransferase